MKECDFPPSSGKEGEYKGEFVRILNNSTRTKRRKGLRKHPTAQEVVLWSRLRNRRLGGYKFFRQYGIERYVVDFCCPAAKLVVELDGGQHLNQEIKDAERDAVLIGLGFRVLRFWNDDVNTDLELVLNVMYEALQTRTPP